MSIIKRHLKNKKTVYEAEVYVRGLRRAYRRFDKKSSAHSWHDQMKEKLKNNPGALKKGSQTFMEILELYKKEKFPTLALSTRQSTQGRHIYFVNSPLSSIKISELSADHIDLWLDWLKVHPKVNHQKRKNFIQELKILGHILHWYHHFKDPSFVVPIVRRHKVKCFYKRTVPRRPDYYMKLEEVRQWLRWLRTRKIMDPVYGRMAAFMVLTGVRVGEVCGLKWDAVDLNKNMVSIFRVVVWDRHSKKPILEERTKTSQSLRTLILPKEIVKMLRDIKKEKPGHEMIFSDRKGRIPPYPSIRDAFTRGFESLNLPWKGTHICRHTYATMALYATRDLPSVQAHLGHRTACMTEKYAKLAGMISSDTAEKTAKVFQLNDCL